MSAYAASKGAVIAMTKALALELAPFKIRVVSINPVATDTPMLPDFFGKADPVEARARFLSHDPLGRLNTPEDIAHAALYLASDEAYMVTGTAFEIDGGRDICTIRTRCARIASACGQMLSPMTPVFCPKCGRPQRDQTSQTSDAPTVRDLRDQVLGIGESRARSLVAATYRMRCYLGGRRWSRRAAIDAGESEDFNCDPAFTACRLMGVMPSQAHMPALDGTSISARSPATGGSQSALEDGPVVRSPLPSSRHVSEWSRPTLFRSWTSSQSHAPVAVATSHCHPDAGGISRSRSVRPLGYSAAPVLRPRPLVAIGTNRPAGS